MMGTRASGSGLWGWPVAAIPLVFAIAVAAQSPRAEDARTAFMRAHFHEAIVMHDAVARGDLPTARAQAERLAAHRPAVPFPTGAQAFFGLMGLEAAKVAKAETLETMAPVAASLLSRCGQCHQAMHVRVAVPTAPEGGVGGLVGQMLAHQRASDLLLEGLIGPSASAWDSGLRSLPELSVRAQDLPNRSLRQRAEIARARLSAVAAEAGAAARPPDRAQAYGRLLTVCAQCHRERPGVWGPRR